MKKVECKEQNCIETPTGCIVWNGGTIDYLGICDGDSLNNLLWEVVHKLQDITGEDLSSFDIDSLIEICNQQAPSEVTILSILNIVKANQICLKDFIDDLNDRLNELFSSTAVNVNLKCYAEFDNLGNSLSISRDELDQLIIDNLCDHEDRLDTLDGKVISLQSQIDNLSTSSTVDELSFATCVNASELPTSSQVINLADAFCDLEDSTGDSSDIASALANTPGDLNAEFGLISGWILTPANWAENYNNLLLEVENLRQRIIFMEENCCAVTCEDVKLGFTAIYNEDNDGVIIKFTAGAGTSIPSGFTGSGSTVVITDVDGNTAEETITIANNSEHEILVTGLNLTGDLTITVTAVITNGSLTCQKCINKIIKKATCAYCEICAAGVEGSSIVIVYETDTETESVLFTTTTTTTSTTTTTTVAP
jgi:hypothetical protein